MSTTATLQTEVLVIGAGLAGATASLALSAYGISNICLSKYSSTSPTPRAHITNQRSMEVLRHFGLEQQAMSLATPQHLMGDHVYCTSVTGFELGRMRAWHTDPRFKAEHDLASPCSVVDLTQDLLEPILLAGATRNGSKVRFDSELIGFEQDPDGVTAQVVDLLNGQKWAVRARYIIGADGANSFVGQELGLPFKGKMGIAGNYNIRFKADLKRFMAHRSGVLYWMIQPGRGIGGYPIAGLRMVHAWDRWITGWGYDVNGAPPELTTAQAIDIVHRIIGDSSVEVEIDGLYNWSMNSVYAQSYRRGRVFCVGDAVHRHSPMNGLGSNTSMQDAFNLAWKLAMVVRGVAGEELLDSFEEERQPIGESVVRRATDNFSVYAPVAQALGFKPGEQSAEQFATMAEKLADPSDEGQARRATLREAIANNIIGFGALGGEHNQFYRSGAVIDDGKHLSVKDPDLNIVWGLEAGRRLPHVWMTHAQHRVSSLDICARGCFTLFTGLAGHFWREAVAMLTLETIVPIVLVQIGPGLIYEDAYGDFARMCLPDERGAILVRPDFFVAWHVDSRPDDPRGALQAALSRILFAANSVSAPGVN